MSGTPKTLSQAIENGFSETGCDLVLLDKDLRKIERHVRDFLAQKFDPIIMDTELGKELWFKITREIL